MIHTYRVHGMVFDSELDFPELCEISRDPGVVPDFHVRLAKLDLEAPPVGVPDFFSTRGRSVLIVPAVGCFEVDQHATVTIEIADSPDMALLRLFFFGSVMGLVCHQLGRLPLHASAISYKGRAFAFSGQAGAGKSTLAAACVKAGAQLVADDILVVSSKSGSRPIANPGMPKIKLWREAIEALGQSTEGLTRDWARADKFHVPAGSVTVSDPVRLSGLFILHDDNDSGFGLTTNFRGSEALSEIIKNTYRPEYLDLVGRREAHFAECARLSTMMPVARLSRRRDTSELMKTAMLVMDSSTVPL
jgi:hypothetical protein